MMKIKLFTMQRNEDDILREWIAYHSRIFGASNIHIIDHLSIKNSVRIIREQFPDVHLRLFSQENNPADMMSTGKQVTKWMLEEKHNCDIMIPIDSDEFITYDGILVDKEKILSELAKLAESNEPAYRFNTYQYTHCGMNGDALVSKTGIRKAPAAKKIFYLSKQFKKTINGNHGNQFNHKIPHCKLCHLHYTVRGYDQFLSKFLLSPEGECDRWTKWGVSLREAKTHEERVNIYNEYLRNQKQEKNIDVSDFIREIKDIKEKNYE